MTGTAVATGVAVGTPVATGVATGTASGSSSQPQVPPPGFGFPMPEYSGKGDVPEPPTADKNSGAPDDNKIPEGESTSSPDKIAFDYSKPPSEIDVFAKQMKSDSSSSSSSTSATSEPVG